MAGSSRVQPNSLAAEPHAVSTRERLLRAVFSVVRRDGLSRLTAVALTAEAGIAQPRFYRYFDSLDSCLAEAAERMAKGFKDVTVALRRQMRDPRDVHELSAHYRAVLEMALQQRTFVELALRTAHEPTVLGKVLRRADGDVRQTFADELYERGQGAGLRERDRAAVRRLADLVLDSVYATIARLLTQPEDEASRAVETLAHELALFTSAGTVAIFEHLLKRPTRRRAGGAREP
ncbi:MAG TPA: TetR/AcrR family transcriptional regulator [Polyangiaceae bacterium]|nr:TetR/AcrR family transcriptional regulator [Polyangiaceae bacterium]